MLCYVWHCNVCGSFTLPLLYLQRLDGPRANLDVVAKRVLAPGGNRTPLSQLVVSYFTVSSVPYHFALECIHIEFSTPVF